MKRQIPTEARLATVVREQIIGLSEDDIRAVCERLCDHLEGWNLIGLVMVLVSHVVYCEQSEDSMLTIQRWLVHYNGHGRDQATDFLRASALKAIRGRTA